MLIIIIVVLLALNTLLFFKLNGVSGGDLLLITLMTSECMGDTFVLHRLIESSGLSPLPQSAPLALDKVKTQRGGIILNHTSKTPGSEFRFPKASLVLAL